MMYTPLLPRPCPRPFTTSGAAHSRWIWQSPNESLVTMSLLAAMAYPSLMTHLSPPVHFERSLPSKRTSASDGGPLSLPGVTTTGSGQTIPDLYSRGSWAVVMVAIAARQPTSGVRSVMVGYPEDRGRVDYLRGGEGGSQSEIKGRSALRRWSAGALECA